MNSVIKSDWELENRFEEIGRGLKGRLNSFRNIQNANSETNMNLI